MAVKFLNGIDVDGSMNIAASDVPNLDASKITSGTFSADRIPTGLYQPAGDYLDLETANTTFQPIGNYLTSVPSEYLTQTEGDARYLTSLPSHNHDTLYDAIGSANAVGQQVNERIDTEVFDAINSKQPAGNYFTDGDTVLNMANNDGLVYNDTNNTMYIKKDGTDYAIIDAGGGTITGTLTLSGGGTKISMNNGDITGVNQILINDPGEGIVWTNGSSGNMTLAIRDDASDNTLNLTGTGAALAINGLTVATQSWVSGQGYLTSIPSTYATDAEVSTAVGAVDTRINDEVMPYISSVETIANSKLDATAKAADSNLLDGIDSSAFLRSNANDSASGNITFSGTITHTGNLVVQGTSPTMSFLDTNAEHDFYIHVNSNNFYVLRNTNTAENLVGTGWDSPHPMQIESDTNSVYFFGNKLNSAAYAATTAFDSAGSAAAVSTALNERIDTEVFGAIGDVAGTIPTNNNQLTNGAGYATTSYVNTAVSNLVASAPAALDTLNELAAALGDDANFSTTVANNIGAIANDVTAVNERIDTEVLPAIDTKQNAGNYATFANNIYLSNSTTTENFITELTNLGAFQDNYKAFKVAWSYAGNSDLNVGFETIELAGCLIECWGGTYKHVRVTRPTTGTGGRSIYVYNDQGSSYAPGWRQIWTSDEFSNTNLSNWNTAYGWGDHSAAGYLTSLPSHNHDTLYDSLGSANAVATALNERIDTEVFDAIATVDGNIPTNNNQLTNGAGYLTAVPSSFTTTNITATGYIKGGGQQLVLSAGEAQNYATGQTAEYIYMNAEQGLEINSDTGNWAGGWAARKTAYLRGDQLTLDGETLTKTNIQNFKTAYGWGNHASAGYLTSIPSTYATDAEVGTAVGVVDARINDEVIPYIDVVAADASKGAVAHGWGDHSAAGYLTSLPAHNHDGSYDPIGSADAVALQVNTRIDQEVIPSIPTNNNQLLNGAGYITAVPSSFSTNSITIGNGVTLSESTDRADLLMIKSSTSTWGGLQISNTSNEIIFSMMGDGNVIGLYDDLNNDWVIQRDENGSMRFYANASNTVTVTTSGLSVTGAITASGDVTAFSDARVKENVETLSNALESVKQMRGVTYNKIGEEKQSVGVIAQELEEVVPQLVHTDEEGMKSVAYGNITAVLIEALKEQQAQIEELKARLDGLTK